MEDFVPEEMPEEAPPEPSPEPEPAIGTNNVGDGPPDGFGLKAGGGGGIFGGKGIGGSGGRGGSKYGWYAGKVQSAVADALRGDRRTRSAVMTLEVKIWADSLGQITRTQLVNSTGDTGLDSALRNDVLGRVRLPEPPPADMPMPINLRITARKAN